MTADTDAVGDILFECDICHVTFKNIDEFNSQEHDCFKNLHKAYMWRVLKVLVRKVLYM